MFIIFIIYIQFILCLIHTHFILLFPFPHTVTPSPTQDCGIVLPSFPPTDYYRTSLPPLPHPTPPHPPQTPQHTGIIHSLLFLTYLTHRTLRTLPYTSVHFVHFVHFGFFLPISYHLYRTPAWLYPYVFHFHTFSMQLIVFMHQNSSSTQLGIIAFWGSAVWSNTVCRLLLLHDEMTVPLR